MKNEKINFKSESLTAIGMCALDLQNKFFDKLRIPRATGIDLDATNHDALLKETYLSFLKNAVEEINVEIDRVKNS